MDLLSILQIIGVTGALVCWVVASVMVSGIRERQGKPTPWYRTFMWWLDYDEMRKTPGPKPEGYDTLNIVFWLFLICGIGPNILRIFL